MKQILHIFVKDVRHQWLEILFSLAVTLALVFTCPSRWRHGAYGGVVSFSLFGLANSLPESSRARHSIELVAVDLSGHS